MSASKEAFRRALAYEVEVMKKPCHFVARDRKLDRWFVVDHLEFDRISGHPSVVSGYVPGSEDKDGITVCGGYERYYCRKPRYEVYHRLSRQPLHPF